MSPERFPEEWLRLREPVDHRSRAGPLVEQLAQSWDGRDRVRLVDLGCGAGSNLRYVSSRLQPGQTWVLVDHDLDLLRRVECPVSVRAVERVHTDLDDYVSELARDRRPVDGVTASALLDLVSGLWLERFVEVCCTRRCPVLAALTYDGAIDWCEPGGAAAPSELRRVSEPDDDDVRDAVNDHQRGDKGVGAGARPGGRGAHGRALRATRLSGRGGAEPVASRLAGR